MNKKGFTLVELLGVIVILSIIMLIAVPNITSVLERSKRDGYISDAKTFVSLVEYELRKGNLNKPTSNEIFKVTLGYISTNDITTDPDGNEYHKTNSYVTITRDDGYLVYHVNLVAEDENGELNGISLVNRDDLDKDNRYEKVKTNVKNLSETQIKNIVGTRQTLTTF